MEARQVRPWLGLLLTAFFSSHTCGQYGAPVAVVLPASAGGPWAAPVMPVVHSVPAVSPVVASRAGVNPGSRGQAVGQSQNFIVFASSADWAGQVAEVAEQQRRDLAIHWFGRELPPWSQRCPIHVQDAANLGAGGETRFALSRGVPGNWMMSVQGTRERILDSELPHEITHTLFATYFGRLNKYVPRGADEGAATTVEHEAEKKKHRHFLKQFLKTGRGLAFNEMFRLKEYPQDILPLYAQGHSAVQFLIDQADPQHFIHFLEFGMQSENWSASLDKFYAYASIGEFQISWNQWLVDGSPKDLLAYSPLLRRQSTIAGNVAVASAEAPIPMQSDSSGGSEANSPTGQSESGLSGIQIAASLEGQLAANTRALDAGSTGGSFFRQKLHSTSGKPATPIPPHNHYSGSGGYGTDPSLRQVGISPSGALQHQRQEPVLPAGAPSNAASVMARPQPQHSPEMQVLDWGQGGQVSGLNADNSSSPWLR
ncbi:MAG TPA: hypothetical protein DCF63_15445 [Planctomycetaceae bacterium]|nr:hypothetical protein [Planctomycetaceae bacterium]